MELSKTEIELLEDNISLKLQEAFCKGCVIGAVVGVVVSIVVLL